MALYPSMTGPHERHIQKIIEWYGAEFTLTPNQKEMIMEIISFNEDLFDKDALFKRIECDCYVYLYEFYMSKDEDSCVNALRHMRIIAKSLDSVLFYLSTGATEKMMASNYYNRMQDNEFVKNNREALIETEDLPECHHLFQSSYKSLFKQNKFHGHDPKGIAGKADHPIYPLKSDAIMEEKQIQFREMAIQNSDIHSYAYIVHQIERGIEKDFTEKNKEIAVSLIEQNMAIVQHLAMHNAYEYIRGIRLSTECIIKQLSRKKMVGDPYFAKLVRKLSSTYSISIDESEKKYKKNEKIRTYGYTNKNNKKFVTYVSELLKNFIISCGIQPSNTLLSVKSSLETASQNQNYYLNMARKDTNLHQVTPCNNKISITTEQKDDKHE